MAAGDEFYIDAKSIQRMKDIVTKSTRFGTVDLYKRKSLCVTMANAITDPKKALDRYEASTYVFGMNVPEANIFLDRAINSKVTDIEYLRKIKNKLKTMRQSAVEKYGEFSVENLAFKKLRNDGYIEKLFDYTASVFDDNLSVEGIQNRNLNRLT